MGIEYYLIIFGVVLFVIGIIANSAPTPEELKMQMDIINKKKQDVLDSIKSVNETRIKAASKSLQCYGMRLLARRQKKILIKMN